MIIRLYKDGNGIGFLKVLMIIRFYKNCNGTGVLRTMIIRFYKDLMELGF